MNKKRLLSSICLMFFLFTVISPLIGWENNVYAVSDTSLEVQAPSNVEANAVDKNIKISWQPVVSRTTAGYAIYRSTSENSRLVRIGSTKDTYFLDTKAEPNTLYYYYVRTYDINGNLSAPSSLVRAMVQTQTIIQQTAPSLPQAPASLSANAIDDNIKIFWRPVVSRTTAGYAIYRSTSENSRFTRIGSTKDTSYLDTNIEPNTLYYYYVRTYDINGNLSDPSSMVRAMAQTQTIIQQVKPSEHAVIVNDKYYDKDIISYFLWKKPQEDPIQLATALADLLIISEEAIKKGIQDYPEVQREIKHNYEHFYLNYILAKRNPRLSYEQFKKEKIRLEENLLNEALIGKEIKMVELDNPTLDNIFSLQEEDKTIVAYVNGDPIYLQEVLAVIPTFSKAMYLAAPDREYFVQRVLQNKYILSLMNRLSQNDQEFVEQIMDLIARNTLSDKYHSLFMTGNIKGFELPEISEERLREYYENNKENFSRMLHPGLTAQNKTEASYDDIKGTVKRNLLGEIMQKNFKTHLEALRTKASISIDRASLTAVNGSIFWAERGI